MKKIFLLVFILLVCSLSGCKKKDVEYTVTFVNGEQTETVKYKENDTIEFQTLSKEGYSFNGWTLNGEVVNSYKVNADVTFVASFSKLKFNVNFVVDGNTETVEYEYGDTVNFPNVKKEGYGLKGWKLNGEFVESYVVKEDATFIAEFSKLKFKVSFVIDDDTQIVEYEYGDTVEFPNKDVEGYVLTGWTLNGDIVENYIVKEEVTFVAEYVKLKFNVNFEIDGTTQTVEYEYGDLVAFPDANKEGYTFNGWTLNGEVVESHTVKEEVTFVATYTAIDYVQLAKDYLTSVLPAETIESFTLPTEYENVTISWKTSNASAITTLGEVTQLEYKSTVTLTATLSYNGTTTTAKYKVVVPKLSDEVILNNVLNAYDFDPTFANLKLNLPTDFSTKNSRITSSWESLDSDYLSNEGEIVTLLDAEKEVEIKLTLTLREAIVSATYKVVIPAISMDDLAEIAVGSANIETTITTKKALLPTEFEYDLIGSWQSADESIIDNEGNVKAIVSSDAYVEVKMTLNLKKIDGTEVKSMEYTFKIQNKTHLPIVHAKDYNETKMNNVGLEDGRLVLKDGQTYGEYESDILETISFSECVPSWAAISSTTATVEFLIKVRVNGAWSDYITYCNGGWGLGLQNKAYDKSNSLIKLSTDEIKVLNSKSADAIQFKLILRRTSASNESPKVSLCAFALKGTNYSAQTYSLDSLPSNVKHVVPKLYQGAVPTIGNSICSPTSSTMLLKYKGLSFTDKDSEYEHRYIAGLAKDYGNDIYGNWVYNTVTMSAYGFNSYVARFYSVAELCHHIATVGPVACSMKGQMTSDMKNYYTNGHLITIIGYEYINGVLTLISNDPNVPSVECRYSETVFTNTWRNISYIIE